MISPATIQAVKDLAIEEVIGRYADVTLKKAGNNYKGFCPFHDEKTPSFNVIPAKNFFKCFGCGAGGDGLEFVMRKEGLPFYEAVKSLAQQHGIAIEETETQGKTPEQKNEETIMYEWMAKANRMYVGKMF